MVFPYDMIEGLLGRKRCVNLDDCAVCVLLYSRIQLFSFPNARIHSAPHSTDAGQ